MKKQFGVRMHRCEECGEVFVCLYCTRAMHGSQNREPYRLPGRLAHSKELYLYDKHKHHPVTATRWLCSKCEPNDPKIKFKKNPEHPWRGLGR